LRRAVLSVVAVLLSIIVVITAQGAATAAENDLPGYPPNLDAFPVIGGVGLLWDPTLNTNVPVDGYRVMRYVDSRWNDVSGLLTERTWVDRSISAGERAEYRVLAENADGQGPMGYTTTAVRPATDPEPGDIGVLTVDTNHIGEPPALVDEVASPVTGTAADGRSISMAAGSLRITLPFPLPGPGEHPAGTWDSRVEIKQGDKTCALQGTITVTEVAYTADHRIDTLTAVLSGTCNGTDGIRSELRVRSSHDFAAIAVEPAAVDAGRIRVGSRSDDKTVTVRNTGSGRLTLKAPVIDGSSASWVLGRNTCGATLDAGQACAIDIAAAPVRSGPNSARLVIGDSTERGEHTVTLAVTGTSLPSAPVAVLNRATFTGTDLSWLQPADLGGTPIVGYVVHRYVGGTETKYRVDGSTTAWVDPRRPANATYAVSAINEIGEGTSSQPTAPAPARDQIAAFFGRNGELTQLGALVVPGPSQFVPLGVDDATATWTALTSSPDGRQVAYTTWAEATGHTLWRRRVDSGGVQAPVKLASAHNISSPAWSPDGSRIAYVAGDAGGSTACVNLVATTGGASAQVGCSIGGPTWHADSNSLYVSDSRLGSGVLARVEAKANGKRLQTITTGYPARYLSASPDGKWLAYVVETTDGTDHMRVAIMPTTGGSSSLGTVMGYLSKLSWSADSRQLAIFSYSNGVGSIYTQAVSAIGGHAGSPALVMRTPTDTRFEDITWQGLSPMIKPTPAITGRAVSISFDTSAVAAGAKITCRLDAGLATACSSPYAATALPGGEHTLRVTAAEPGGRTVVVARSFTVDATGPATRMTAPAYAVTLAPSATIQYAATDASGIASYDVRYRRSFLDGTFGGFSQPWTGTKATSVSLGLVPGYEYCVSARARDTHGNVGGWSAERCFSRPVDDRSLAAPTTGWSRVAWSPFYLGTATQTTKYGASLTRSMQAKRIYLVATRCPTCGTVSAYLNDRYIGAINLYSATTVRQAVIALPTQTAVYGGTLRLTTRSTGKLVQIDGLGVRRT
jgi:WD40-like Beta Propeller Repeat